MLRRTVGNVAGVVTLVCLSLACGGGGGGGSDDAVVLPEDNVSFEGTVADAGTSDTGLTLTKTLAKAGDSVKLVNLLGEVLASATVADDDTYTLNISESEIEGEEAVFLVTPSVKTIIASSAWTTSDSIDADISLATTAVVAIVEDQFQVIMGDESLSLGAEGGLSGLDLTDASLLNDVENAFQASTPVAVEYYDDVVLKLSKILSDTSSEDPEGLISSEAVDYYRAVIAGDADESREKITDFVNAIANVEKSSDNAEVFSSDLGVLVGEVVGDAVSTYSVQSSGLYQGYLIDSVTREAIEDATLTFSNGVTQIVSSSDETGFFTLRGIPSHDVELRLTIATNVIAPQATTSLGTGDLSSFWSSVGAAFNGNGQPVVNGDTFLVKIEKDGYFSNSTVLHEIQEKLTDLGPITMAPIITLKGKVLDRLTGEAIGAEIWGWLTSMGDWVSPESITTAAAGNPSLDPLILNETPRATADTTTGEFMIDMPVVDQTGNVGSQDTTGYDLQIYRTGSSTSNGPDFTFEIGNTDDLLDLYKANGAVPGQTVVDISSVFLDSNNFLGTVQGRVVLADDTFAGNAIVHYYSEDLADTTLFQVQGTVTTDENGVFVIPSSAGLPYADINIRAYVEGYNFSAVQVADLDGNGINSSSVLVDLGNINLTELADDGTYAGVVSGYVKDYKTGGVIEGATVKVYSASVVTNVADFRYTTTTDADGMYTIPAGTLDEGDNVSIAVTMTAYVNASETDLLLETLDNDLTGEPVVKVVFLVPVDVDPIAPELNGSRDMTKIDSTGLISYWNGSQSGRVEADTTTAINYDGIATLSKEQLALLTANNAVPFKVYLDNAIGHDHKMYAISFNENGRPSDWVEVTPNTALTSDGRTDFTVDLSTQMGAGNTTYVTILPAPTDDTDYSSNRTILSLTESDLEGDSNFLQLKDETGIELESVGDKTGVTEFSLTFSEGLVGSDIFESGYRDAVDSSVTVAFNNTTIWNMLGGNNLSMSYMDGAASTSEDKIYVELGDASDAVMFGDKAFFYTFGSTATSATNTIVIDDWKGRMDGNDAASSIALVKFSDAFTVESSTLLTPAEYNWTVSSGTLEVLTVSKAIENYNAVVILSSAPTAGATLPAVTGAPEYFGPSDNINIFDGTEIDTADAIIVAATGAFDHVYANSVMKFTAPNGEATDSMAVDEVLTDIFGHSLISFAGTDLQDSTVNLLTGEVLESAATAKIQIDTSNSIYRGAVVASAFKDTNNEWDMPILLPVTLGDASTSNGGNVSVTITYPTVVIDTAGLGGSDNLDTVFAGTITMDLFDDAGSRLIDTDFAVELASAGQTGTTSVSLVSTAANTSVTWLSSVASETNTELDSYAYIQLPSAQAQALLEMASGAFEVSMIAVSSADNIAVGDSIIFYDDDFGIFTDADGIVFPSETESLTRTVTDVNTIDNIVVLDGTVNLAKYDHFDVLGDVITVVAEDAVGNSIHADADEVNMSSGNIQ